MKSIIMQPESVRGIQADIKTETRRVVKPQPDKQPLPPDCYPPGLWISDGGKWMQKCPYGTVGTELYIKESFCPNKNLDSPNYGGYEYRADYDGAMCQDLIKWKSPLFMPEYASRLHIILTDIDVERVQDITAWSAMNEGLEPGTDIITRYHILWNTINEKPKPKYKNKKLHHYESYPWSDADRDPREIINGVPHHCYPNPWVYALKFTKETIV